MFRPNVKDGLASIAVSVGERERGTRAKPAIVTEQN
jgi:hypothetical protein